MENCVTYFGSPFSQISKHCCGNLTIAEEMIARIDPSFVLFDGECEPEEVSTTTEGREEFE